MPNTLRECCDLLDCYPPNPRQFSTFEQARDALAEWKAGPLKRAYRKAAKAAHPDRGGSDEAMRAVNTAYTSLRDDLQARVPRPQPRVVFPGTPMRTGFSNASTTSATSPGTGGFNVRIIIL